MGFLFRSGGEKIGSIKLENAARFKGYHTISPRVHFSHFSVLTNRNEGSPGKEIELTYQCVWCRRWKDKIQASVYDRLGTCLHHVAICAEKG